MVTQLRTLWLSDIHLGTQAARASDLLRFLAEVKADRIYLVGDIVDLQYMRIRPDFPSPHWQVVLRAFELSLQGVKIVYIPGNHDHEMRQLAGRSVFDIRIVREAWHTTADDRELLVVHGDCLDETVRQGTNLERFGSAAYGWLVRADARINRLRNRLGQDHASLATGIKMRLKSASEYIARYEAAAVRYAHLRGADGIVCGHIHRPALEQRGNVCYANDGDWVEHRTAIGELPDGELQLLRWQDDAVCTMEKDDGKSLVAA